MYRLLAICVILATVIAGAHGQLFPRWLSRGQLPAPRQHAAAAAASRDEAFPTSAVDTVWSKATDGTDNSMMYFIEMKQELFVFGKAVPAPISSPGIPADTGAPSASTRAPATSTRMPNKSTSAPVTSTSAPTTGLSTPSISSSAPLPSSTIPLVPASITSPGILADTDAPAMSTRMPTSSTSVPAMSTNAPTTITSTPATRTNAPAASTRMQTTSTTALATSTSAPTTSTSAPTTGTSAPSISSNVLLSSSTNPAASTSETSTTASAATATTSTPPPTRKIPPGYTYYAATGSSYKFHKRYVSWDVANTTCASEGAHLLVLNDAQEADIVARIVIDAVGHYFYYTWTALRDNRPGGVMEWRTVHGEPLSDVFHEWGDGEPSNDAERRCAVFSAYHKRLHDLPCDVTYYFTCETSR